MGDSVREGRERIRTTLGGSYVGRSSGKVTRAIRFIDPDTWQLTTVEGTSITWKRQP